MMQYIKLSESQSQSTMDSEGNSFNQDFEKFQEQMEKFNHLTPKTITNAKQIVTQSFLKIFQTHRTYLIENLTCNQNLISYYSQLLAKIEEVKKKLSQIHPNDSRQLTRQNELLELENKLLANRCESEEKIAETLNQQIKTMNQSIDELRSYKSKSLQQVNKISALLAKGGRDQERKFLQQKRFLLLRANQKLSQRHASLIFENCSLVLIQEQLETTHLDLLRVLLKSKPKSSLIRKMEAVARQDKN